MDKNMELALSKTIIKNNNDRIFIDPLCDFFGINTLNQIERIKNDEICQSDIGKNSDYFVFGDYRQRSDLGKRGFIRWIQIISPAIVRTELRELFVKYQVAIFDYLYNGNEAKILQLEDIRNYALNINSALKVKDQIMEFIKEQKNHRDLCLEAEPSQWVQIKPTLTEEKRLPEIAESMKAIGYTLPTDLEQLKHLKKNNQSNISKCNILLMYQGNKIKSVENPMPEGFRRERLKMIIKDHEAKIEAINAAMNDILK